MTIADRLKAARAALRLKQEEMVAISGIPIDTYRKYEGDKSDPGAKALAGLAKAGIDLNWLITGVSYVSDETGNKFFEYPGRALIASEPSGSEYAVSRTSIAEINVDALEAILEGALKVAPNASPEALAKHCAGVYKKCIEDGLITPDGVGSGNLDAAA